MRLIIWVPALLLLAINGSAALAQSTEITRKPVEVEIDGDLTRGWLSPDERHVVFVQRDGRDLEILIANADGTGARKLTDNNELDYQPDWSPDSTAIVFCSARSGIHQLYSISLDGGDLRRLTDHEFGCRLPRYNSNGDLAWQRMREPTGGKSQPATLVIRRGDEERDIFDSDLFSDFAWSPGGTWLAVGSVGKLDFVEPDSDERLSFSLYELDERLHAHAPRDFQWSPDGDAVACRIRFVGGRMGDVTIFGDNQVFVISLSGDFDYFNSEDQAREKHDWIR